jgi:hypothetical protein
MKLSEERILKIKESLKGNTHTKGKKISEEHRNKIIKSLQGHKMSAKNNEILNYYRKSKKTQEQKDKMSKSKIEKYGVKIICLQTKEKFNSLIEASLKIGTSYQGIRQSIIRGGKCKGLNYYYLNKELSVEEIDLLINTDLRKNKKTRPNNKNICRELFGKKIYCEELDLNFKSISEASEFFSVSTTTIGNYLSLNKKIQNKYSLKRLC